VVICRKGSSLKVEIIPMLVLQILLI
jgi:hypothetical protein